jgi:deoxycytidine triphosphate deaminase
MIISPMIILELNERYNVIENLSERELKNPEGLGFDIRVGEVYKISGNGLLGVTERKTPDSILIASVSSGHKGVIIKPNGFVLVKTMEKLNIPSKAININGQDMLLVPLAYPRSTLQRSGITLLVAKTDPGYLGELVV